MTQGVVMPADKDMEDKSTPVKIHVKHDFDVPALGNNFTRWVSRVH